MSGREDKGIVDLLKRISSLGPGGAFLSEDTLKNLLKDLPLPKTILNGLVENARSMKAEFASSLREEFGSHLSKIDTKRIVEHLADNYDIEVKASFSLKRKKGRGKE